jgi:signal peptidase I
MTLPPHRRIGLAIMLAGFILLVFLTQLHVERYRLSGPSMSPLIDEGDVVWVNKLAYGLRTKGGLLPGLSSLQRDDVVVLHQPANDSVVVGHEHQTYRQLIRDHGRANVHDPNFTLPVIRDGRIQDVAMGRVEYRPIADRLPIVARCMAVAGDTLEVRRSYAWVNGIPEEDTLRYWLEYRITTDDQRSADQLVGELRLDPATLRMDEERNLVATLAPGPKGADKRWPEHVRVEAVLTPAGSINAHSKWPWYPNHTDFDWTMDFMGPIVVPKKGMTIPLDARTLIMYGDVIRIHEGRQLASYSGRPHVDGEPASSYTFSKDYFWVMGDNRHRAMDSRFWGFVPMDHLIGKVAFIQ